MASKPVSGTVSICWKQMVDAGALPMPLEVLDELIKKAESERLS